MENVVYDLVFQYEAGADVYDLAYWFGHAVAGPYYVSAGQVHSPGAIVGETFSAGIAAGQTHAAGATVGQAV